ncbi:MAG: hypothetical protein LKG15_03185 [Corynebacterium provencense]|jgi:hypothetical protein|uniref:hypothetical protein n=1 Tax=Corynebacterium provencense TaxID=1737425 RepID=UPI002989CE3C|nr:hypothetical protein [Corynebacterium provencense]
MSNPQLSALGFGSRTFDGVESKVIRQVSLTPGITAVFDDPSGIRVVLPAATARVGANTVLVRSRETVPGHLTQESDTVAKVRLTPADGNPVEFNAAVGDWSLAARAASRAMELEIGATAVKANIERIHAVTLRRRRRAGRNGLPGVLRPSPTTECHLEGAVVAWALKTNKLTRGTWYQVLVESVVPVTVAVPVTVGKIAVGDHLVCDAVMSVTVAGPTESEVAVDPAESVVTVGETRPAQPADRSAKSTVAAPTVDLTISTDDRKLLALGFSASSRDALVSEVRDSSQLHRVFEDSYGDFIDVRRYEDPSGAVLLLIGEEGGSTRMIPLISGDSADRVETTAEPSRGDVTLDIYAGDVSVTGIPADSDDYWSAPGSTDHLTPGRYTGTGALAVDIRVSGGTGPVLRKTVHDPDRGLTWISGVVISNEVQLNELTGLEWYRVTVDAGVPVTVAVPETVAVIPEVGSRLWGDVRFCVQSGVWKTPGKQQEKKTAAESAPVPAPAAPVPAGDPEDTELEDIDDIDDLDDDEIPGAGTDSPAPVVDAPETPGEEKATGPVPAPSLEPSPAPAPAAVADPSPADPAEPEDTIADLGPLPRGWLTSVSKGLGIDHRTPDNTAFPHVSRPTWSAPFAVTEVRNTPGDPYLGTVHIDLRFPLTASFCDCAAFAKHASCVHLYPAFRHLHDVLGEEGPSAKELFARLGDDPVGAFFKQYVSDSQVMARFDEVVRKNGGDVHQAVRDVITGIAGPEAPGDPGIRKVVDDAIDNGLDMLPVLRRVMTHVGENPDDGSRNDLFRVIDMSFRGNPSQELRQSALQALPTLFTASEVPDDDRRSLAALVVALFRRGHVGDALPFLTVEDHLGRPGIHTLRFLLGSWKNELSARTDTTKTTDGERFRALYRLAAEAFGTLHERVTSLLQADPPELTTAVLLLESHGDHEKALEALQIMLKHLPANVTTTTPYQMPLHDALQILMKNRRKKGAAKVARRQFRENPCWDSYRDLEDALKMSGVATVLQERDRILIQLDDTEELTLDEVEVLVRIRLQARDFDKALTVMESRGLYEPGWAEDTEDIRRFIRTTIGGNLPDKVVGIAFRDAELAARNDGSVDADGLKDAAEILATARGVAARVKKNEEFSRALAAFRKTHRSNSLFMAILDAEGLTGKS